MEVFMNLTKNDTVVAVENKIVPSSLVLDSLNPFPGYYHETPTHPQHIYIYMVLDRQYPLEEILRATQNIEKEYSWDFDAGKGYLTIGTENFNAIRMRHLPQIDLVEKIQNAYINQGIGFLLNSKTKGQLNVQVKIVKFSTLEEIGKHIYISLKESGFAYIEIPRYLNSEDFTNVSIDVKYNWDGHEFDAACGSFYSNGKLYEVIRIRSDKIDLEYLSKVRKLYLEKM